MKRGKGKGKGSAFEREVARALSRWLTGGEDSTQLIRSTLSGGWRAGKVNDEPWRHAGDLAPNGPAGEAFRRRFVIECKHRKDIDLARLWTREKGETLPGWWAKLLDEAGALSLWPLLIFRSNRMPTMVLAPDHLIERRTPEGWLFSGLTQVARFEWRAIVCFPFADLLAGDPDRVISLGWIPGRKE